MTTFNGLKFLIVDDDSIMRKLLAKKLSNFNASVDEAEDGVQALEKLQRDTYDVVITDIRMPKSDGFTLIQNMTEQLSYKPIVFLSSGYEELNLDTVKNIGVFDIFEKPYVFENIIWSICHALNLKYEPNDIVNLE